MASKTGLYNKSTHIRDTVHTVVVHIVYNNTKTIYKQEGIIPAPEANHAVKGAIVEALKAKEAGESKTILFNLCGHGHFDMQAYMDYFGGKLQDQDYDEGEVAMALSNLPSFQG